MGIGQFIVLVLYLIGWVVTIRSFVQGGDENFAAVFVGLHIIAMCFFLLGCIIHFWNTPVF